MEISICYDPKQVLLMKPFELLVQVIQPVKWVCGPNGKTKTQKADPISVGPANFTMDISWDIFLTHIATLLKCQQNQLSIVAGPDGPASDTRGGWWGESGWNAYK